MPIEHISRPLRLDNRRAFTEKRDRGEKNESNKYFSIVQLFFLTQHQCREQTDDVHVRRNNMCARHKWLNCKMYGEKSQMDVGRRDENNNPNSNDIWTSRNDLWHAINKGNKNAS